MDLNNVFKDTIAAFCNALLDLWPVFKPYTIASLIGAFLWFCVHSVIRFISKLSGDSKRKTQRQVRKAKIWFDFLSNISDSFGRKKQIHLQLLAKL